MSIDYYFYVETRVSGAWTRPDACAERGHELGHASLSRHMALGQFTWLRRRAPAAALFFGPAALFPFREGRPPDSEASELFAYIAQGLDWDELDPRWLPFDELLVDSWNEPSLLLTARVPVALARSFTSGVDVFPEADLVARGCATETITELRSGTLTSQPIDRTQGKARFELETAAPEGLVSVTWQDSVATLLGDERLEAFRALRTYGADHELRVIALLG